MSFDFQFDPGLSKADRYQQLAEAAKALMHGESDPIANAANFSALVYSALPDINWAGFYFQGDDELVVGPFQGLPACIRIPLGKGVCGKAALSGETQLVADVNQFPGHIACDSATRSELVVPILQGHQVYAVFDLDSPLTARFDETDRQGIEQLVSLYQQTLT
jgi:GAF domain-containing protein